MLRAALLLLAMLASGFASPVVAQSLGLVKLPAAFVGQPPIHKAPVSAIAEVAPHKAAVSAETLVLAPPPPAATTRFVPRPVPQPQAITAKPYSAVAHRLPSIDTSARSYAGGIAQYGPFRVIDENRVALMGETDRESPRWFRVMLRNHPGLSQIDMVECPGTRDDIANLKLGRMIRSAGLSTYVPRRGSVRSGAVELFLAGAVREIAEGAEFAVHSWMDEQGREAHEFAMDAPQNRRYLSYYREMGMSERDARAFYSFTNSVPHREARWLGAREMRRWIGGAPRPAQIAHAAF